MDIYKNRKLIFSTPFSLICLCKLNAKPPLIKRVGFFKFLKVYSRKVGLWASPIKYKIQFFLISVFSNKQLFFFFEKEEI